MHSIARQKPLHQGHVKVSVGRSWHPYSKRCRHFNIVWSVCCCITTIIEIP